MYADVKLFIDGAWTAGSRGRELDVINPATDAVIGKLAHAEPDDLDRVLAAAERGFAAWRKVSAYERAKLMRRAAGLMRERTEDIARLTTLEEGKPLAEARMEITSAGDIIEWFAAEAQRAFGQLIPPRVEGVTQLVVREPVGVVACFTPWNFPMTQAVRKVAAALAAGCAVILKGPEETPAACAALVQVFQDAGLPPGVLQLVFGVPAEISEYLTPSPVVRKISFTGSTVVGKHLAALAGKHMKRATMELGGHAPVIVFDDADLDTAVAQMVAFKYRNAGQVCASPTRFLIQQGVYEPFVDRFVALAGQIKVGDGLDPETRMGPLANPRRVVAMDGFIHDALAKGATLRLGGKRVGNVGNFYAPSVLTGLTLEMKVMNEEPFGPLALMLPFEGFDDAVKEANRLPYGLASYAYTRSAKTAAAISSAVEAGMMAINNTGLALPEVPFGGVKDSGYGVEGGTEAIDAYLTTKFITHLGL